MADSSAVRRFGSGGGGETAAVRFFRRLARGESEATPARALTAVAAVITVAVALIVLAIYGIQALV